MKTVVSSLTLLVFAISGMLFLQWKVYSESQDELPFVQQYVQIQHDQDILHVVQTIKGVEKGTYPIRNPLKVEYRVKDMKVVDSSLIVKDDQENVEFQYSIPFEKSESSTLLLDWAIQLDGLKTDYSHVEMTVGDGQSGSWAAATKPLGKAKKEFIDYYAFEREGPVFPLYYQQDEMSHLSLENGVVVYFEPNKKLDANQISSLFSSFPEINDHVLMFTSKHQEIVWSDLVVLKDTYSMDELKQKLSSIYLDAVVPFENEQEKWQQNIIGNLLNNKREGSKKVIAMMDVLKEELEEEALRKFVDEVVHLDKPLTSDILDETFSAVTGKKTAFFSLNNDEQSPLSPLYYADSRKIVVNGTGINGSLVHMDFNQLMPFSPIVEQLGYYLKIEKDGHLLVIRDEDTLRLYPDEKVFILNGKDYAADSSPVTRINNQIFIHRHWLNDLLGTTIAEQENVIEITSM